MMNYAELIWRAAGLGVGALAGWLVAGRTGALVVGGAGALFTPELIAYGARASRAARTIAR